MVGMTFDEYLDSKVPIVFQNPVQDTHCCVVYFCVQCAYDTIAQMLRERTALRLKVIDLVQFRNNIEQGGHTPFDPFVHATRINDEINRCKVVILALSLYIEQFTRERAGESYL